MLWRPRSWFFLSAMLEFIRCKRIGTIFIVKLAGEGYFTASTPDPAVRLFPSLLLYPSLARQFRVNRQDGVNFHPVAVM